MVCNGLTGLPAAVEAAWLDVVVQTCIVRLTRASLRWVSYKDRKRVAAQLRLIYGAPTEQAAREAAWEQVIPFFAFPPEAARSSTPRT